MVGPKREPSSGSRLRDDEPGADLAPCPRCGARPIVVQYVEGCGARPDESADPVGGRKSGAVPYRPRGPSPRSRARKSGRDSRSGPAVLTAPELLGRLVLEVPLDAEPKAGGSAAAPFDLTDPRPGPLDSALGAGLRRRVGRALDALPPAAAALVRLRYGFAASGLCWSRAAIAGLLAWTSRGSRGSKPRPWRTCAARCSNGRASADH